MSLQPDEVSLCRDNIMCCYLSIFFERCANELWDLNLYLLEYLGKHWMACTSDKTKSPKSEAWRGVSQDGQNWFKEFRPSISLAFVKVTYKSSAYICVFHNPP